MIGRIVEVADDRRHLSLHRGFMVVQDTEGERKELGQVPLDDIAAVIANAVRELRAAYERHASGAGVRVDDVTMRVKDALAWERKRDSCDAIGDVSAARDACH